MIKNLIFTLLLFNLGALFAAKQGSTPMEYDYGIPPLVTLPSECGKFFTGVDLSLFRCASEGQVFGTQYIEGEDLESIGAVKRLYFPPSYDLGFRLALGYDLPGDQWAASATWTYYSSSQSASRTDLGFGSSRKGGSFFIPGLNGIAMVGNQLFPLKSHGKWHLTFHQLDFEASRDFVLGPAYAMRPTVGLRLVNLKEQVHYHAETLSESPVDYLTSSLKGNLWAFGPSIGLDNFLELGFGLGGFVNAKASLLVAHRDQTQHLNAPLAIDPFDLYAVDFNIDTVGLKPALDFALGLEWRMPLHSRLHFFFLRLAFEDHLIFNALEYPYLDSTSTYLPSFHQEPHDFALYGFTLSVGFNI